MVNSKEIDKMEKSVKVRESTGYTVFKYVNTVIMILIRLTTAQNTLTKGLLQI